MSKILTLIAVLMLVIWTMGLFVFNIGNLIHFFLLLAALLMILKVIREK
ncbi:lmo0937 family membrane protein [Arenibacter sp. H213]|uniref:Lmo0937 family membrane protein n=1 Tax=Arenibacter antarcticus TaxID=2040469 RepID=A0ABW5VHM8_9FLAO|nr:lmo0937 family membrane protein [Arenibacter sp. H213]